MSSIGTLSEIEINTKDLLPQQEPFVMIERLVVCDDMTATTTTTIKEDNILVVDGEFTTAGIVENIAQTCAAHMGYQGLRNGNGIRIGVIGAVKNLIITRNPLVNETITTTITIREEVFGMRLIEGIVTTGNNIIASCEMKIA